MPKTFTPELSLRTAVLLGVTAATAGFLNVSVMRIGSDSAEPISTESSDIAPTSPESSNDVIAVVVDVTVPISTTNASAADLAVVSPDAEGTTDSPTASRGIAAKVPAASPTTQPPGPVAPAPVVTAPPTPAPTAPAPTPGPPTTSAPTTQVPTTPAPTTAAPTTAQPESTTEYLYYSFSGVASQIVIAYHDGNTLEFWSASTESGWVFDVERNSPSVIEVKFFNTNSGDEAKFVIEREGGGLEVKKER